jgi:multiple sugar transport system permease protein
MAQLGTRASTRLSIFLFLAPALIVLSCIMVYPIFMGIAMSVSKIDLGTFKLTFIGFERFAKVLGEEEFWRTVRNSLVWVFGCTAGQFLTGFAMALLLDRDLPGVMFFRVILLLPWTVPGVVIAFDWFWLYHSDFGMLSLFIERIRGSAIALLSNPDTALGAIMVANIWWGYPFAMLMLLAGLRTVPQSLYDAATVDGASSLQVLRHVIVPWLRPVMTIVIILETIYTLNGFTLVKIMTGGGPAGATDIFGMLIYRKGFAFFHFEEAAATSLFVLIIALVLALFYLRVISGRRNIESDE